MGTHALLIALLAVAPAASPDSETAIATVASVKADAPQRSPRELRQVVRDALRRQATAKAAEQELALRELAGVYRELAASARLTPEERLELGGIVRSRLARSGQVLKRRLAKIEMDSERAILAQVRGNPGQPRPAAAAAGGGGGGAAQALADMTAQNAQRLIDLIQTTIAPGSWDVRGGPGTMVYFAPKMVLVANQTDEVHEQLGPFIDALRGH